MVNVYNVLSINTKRNDIGDLLFDTTDYILLVLQQNVHEIKSKT